MSSNPPRARGGFVAPRVIEVHDNMDQNVIQITEDRLKLILKDHLDDVEKKSEWQTPFAIVISIITTFCTAKFDTFAGVNADTWRSFFILSCVASIIWLLVSIISRKKKISLDQLVNKIKNI